MIRETDPAARAGDVVRVIDKQGQYFGRGFYHDQSQIGLRILTHEDRPVDDAFFRDVLSRAVSWRLQMFDGDQTTNAYRLVHAEGDALSGLIVERYSDVIAIEVFSLGVYRRLPLFRQLLTELTGVSRFVVRADETTQRYEGFGLREHAFGDPPATVNVTENGLRFRVDLMQGHKTGFFCDQRDNRAKLGKLCRDAEVLDACCYTGGFGVYAAAVGGAKEVTGVDLDEDAIAMAKKNANLNNVRINHVHADAFGYLRQMQQNRRKFDVVVLDPPKFVPTRNDYEEGGRKYVDLNTLAMTVLKPGGLLLTCSCSGLVSWEDFAGMVKAATNRLRTRMQIVDESGAGMDHPVAANCPESGYLKAIWARIG